MIIAEGDNKFVNDINLAVCIFPPELCTNESLAEYMVEYTRFYANRFIWISDKIDIVDSKSIDDGMLQYGEKYDHILFMAAGVRIYDSSIIVDVSNVARDNPKYLAAAHILDWNDRDMWYELHHQFVLINTKNWCSLNKPHFGFWSPFYDPVLYDSSGNEVPVNLLNIWTQHERYFSKVSWKYWSDCMAQPTKDKTLPVIERSKENFHDHYTPLWIKDTGEREKIPDGLHLAPGHNIIDAAFKNNMVVVNWDKNIRSKRTYYYPEENSDLMWDSIQEKKYHKDITNFNQKQFLQLIEQGVQDQIWLLNSEDMYLQNEGKQYSTIALPASGFKFLDSFHSNAIKPDGTLILFDFNPLAIQWMEHIYNTEATTIEDILLQYKGDPKHFKWFGNNRQFNDIQDLIRHPSFQQGLKLTNEYFNNNTTKYIEQFRKQNVKFIQVDLIKKPDDLLQDIKGDGLIHISNIFSTDWLIASEGLIKAQQYFNSFLSRVEQQSIRITGHSPSGEWL